MKGVSEINADRSRDDSHATDIMQMAQRAMDDPEVAAEFSPTQGAWFARKFNCEDKLIDFIEQGWDQLEPQTPFTRTWSVEAMCDHLQAVTTGEVKKLLINVPPGFTKSMTTSVFWPAWEWGPRNRPHMRYIGMSYADKLSMRDNVRCRDLIKSPWYQERWGHGFDWKDDQNLKSYYENTATGWRLAASSGSALTGFRGDRLILDDPHSVKGADSDVKREDTIQWFSETLPTRVNSKQSAFVVIMQRVHEQDVSGVILEKELGYTHLMLPMEFEEERRCYTIVRPTWMDTPVIHRVAKIPKTDMWVREGQAIPEGYEKHEGSLVYRPMYLQDPRTEDGQLLAPERFDTEQVEDLKKTMRAWGGTYAEAGQLQQRPAPRGGGLFKRDLWCIVDDIPGSLLFEVGGWDFAATDSKSAAYTARVRMGLLRDGRVIITNVTRVQKGPAEVEAFIKRTVTEDGPDIVQDMPQDPGQAGKVQKAALISMLEGYPVFFSPESGDKAMRAQPLAAQQEAGNILLLRGGWNGDFINEAATFPAGKFKDQIDAASRAYGRLLTRKRQEEVLGDGGGEAGTPC